MTLLKQLPWIGVVIFLLVQRMIPSPATQASASQVAKVHELDVVDAKGNVRISMTTTSDGAAILSFRTADGSSPSVLSQNADGTMTLRFAGNNQEPAVLLQSNLRYGGPSLLLTGKSYPEQRLLLGFHVDDVPSDVSRVWGLFLPATDGFHDVAAVAASRDRKTGQITGFVIPDRK